MLCDRQVFAPGISVQSGELLIVGQMREWQLL
jgi:hypothetical protein